MRMQGPRNGPDSWPTKPQPIPEDQAGPAADMEKAAKRNRNFLLNVPATNPEIKEGAMRIAGQDRKDLDMDFAILRAKLTRGGDRSSMLEDSTLESEISDNTETKKPIDFKDSSDTKYAVSDKKPLSAIVKNTVKGVLKRVFNSRKKPTREVKPLPQFKDVDTDSNTIEYDGNIQELTKAEADELRKAYEEPISAAELMADGEETVEKPVPDITKLPAELRQRHQELIATYAEEENTALNTITYNLAILKKLAQKNDPDTLEAIRTYEAENKKISKKIRDDKIELYRILLNKDVLGKIDAVEEEMPEPSVERQKDMEEYVAKRSAKQISGASSTTEEEAEISIA